MLAMNRQIAVPLLLALSMLVPGAALAGAGGTVEVKTEVVLKESFPAFHGKVKAKNENCVEDRRVKLYRKRNNSNKLLGKDRANNDGKWEILVDPLKSGAYFAKAPHVEQGTAGTIYSCERGKSKVAVVD
jgi:hypothetical protein